MREGKRAYVSVCLVRRMCMCGAKDLKACAACEQELQGGGTGKHLRMACTHVRRDVLKRLHLETPRSRTGARYN